VIIKIWDDEEYDEVLFERQHASTELCDALYKHPSGWAMISAGSRALCPILIHRFIFFATSDIHRISPSGRQTRFISVLPMIDCPVTMLRSAPSSGHLPRA
jgi:hypothetical protein